MPDWADRVMTGLFSAAGVAALAGWYIKIILARHKIALESKAADHEMTAESTATERKHTRQDRAAHVGFLEQALEDTKKERDACLGRYDVLQQLRETESSRAKSEQTACLIEKERLKMSETFLLKALDEKTSLVLSLQSELATRPHPE